MPNQGMESIGGAAQTCISYEHETKDPRSDLGCFDR